MNLLRDLRRGQPISARVAIVVAHPDDETLGLGGVLSLFEQATVIQITDGAPDDADTWARAGAATRLAYAELRAAEREAAWRAAAWPLPAVDLGIPDQGATMRLAALVDRLAELLRGMDLVWTHPYEGGHPDHDAAAFAVQMACRSLNPAPTRYEFTSYHWNGQIRVTGRFWPSTHEALYQAIVGEQLARKERALAAYVSQRSVLRGFVPALEGYRLAPNYDFTRHPDPPACWYDRKPFGLTSDVWRAAATAALAGMAA